MISNRQRRKNREELLKYMYQVELNPHSASQDDGYLAMVVSIHEMKVEIDELYTQQDESWLRRDVIDKIILNIGAYEILYTENNNSNYTINESVDLAKKYCAENSYKFINYMLDALANAKQKL